MAALTSLVASGIALWLLPAEVHHGRGEPGSAASGAAEDMRSDGQRDGTPTHAGTMDMDIA